MTSIAPLSVAGLIEFHVLDTDPPILRTYCMSLCYTKKRPDNMQDVGWKMRELY